MFLIQKLAKLRKPVPVASDLVKETDYHTEISETVEKHITNSNHNEFMSGRIYAKIKQK